MKLWMKASTCPSLGGKGDKEGGVGEGWANEDRRERVPRKRISFRYMYIYVGVVISILYHA